jgi:hypothetical protein
MVLVVATSHDSFIHAFFLKNGGEEYHSPEDGQELSY